MKIHRFITVIGFLLLATAMRGQERDTVYVSNQYTTTFYFQTDVIYAKISDPSVIGSAMPQNNREVVFVRARTPFSGSYSFTCLEASGRPHTYILKYDHDPRTLLVDEKNGIRNQEPDTLCLSSSLMTLLIFPSEVVVTDLSRRRLVAEETIKESPNVLSLMARSADPELSSLSLLEADGFVHTYIIRHQENPEKVIIDYRTGIAGATEAERPNRSVTALRYGDAPSLKDVYKQPQSLYHLATRKGRIEVVCENIFTYSDILYITLRLKNNSGVSYETDGASFVLKRKRKARRQDDNSMPIIPSSVYGVLTAAPGQTAKASFSFKKLTLQENQCIEVKIYEKGYEDVGGREFVLKLDAKDINLARVPEIKD